ncbi:MAG: bifunctional adenosylcobinamide kinase/adenosylcobinamide-phosphate guanylyltransferase [Lachnospiraceae bacterium]|nr:bifunctional adenosylcobinamide kinase/adenosylcobinamide-phosphate guanylyltransferase [Lachnospiraceae bacterium]
MMLLYIGGAASGKSELAEKRAIELSENNHAEGLPLYYIATMQRTDAESEERIKRHRERRKGTAFQTIEAPAELSEAVRREGVPENSIVLLECLSNLAANSFFAPENEKSRTENPEAFRGQLSDRLFSELTELEERVGYLIIVSNNLFCSSEKYDKDTSDYLRFLSVLNIRLAERAEEVTEAVAGTGVPLKRCKVM